MGYKLNTYLVKLNGKSQGGIIAKNKVNALLNAKKLYAGDRRKVTIGRKI